LELKIIPNVSPSTRTEPIGYVRIVHDPPATL